MPIVWRQRVRGTIEMKMGSHLREHVMGLGFRV
jgi:hypothetical protein